ncbi:MAG: hypothetical protein EOM10_08000, partial [Opitutae bacterium]|nr:hypothetical protein [Opitutae bacterium]
MPRATPSPGTPPAVPANSKSSTSPTSPKPPATSPSDPSAWMKKPAFLKQVMMVRVLYALLPVALAAIYLFGWRVLALVGVSALFAFLAEWIMVPTPPGKISQAVWVTAALYGLALPPTTPFWIAAVGAVFGIVFGKMVFGGFGKNIFNPAIVGRAFVYVCFPVELTSKFVPAFRGFPGGFARWSFEALKDLPAEL